MFIYLQDIPGNKTMVSSRELLIIADLPRCSIVRLEVVGVGRE
jgi:hypothetical protein